MLLIYGWLLLSLFSFIPLLKVTSESGGSWWAECVVVVAIYSSFLSFRKTVNTPMDCEKRGAKERMGYFGFLYNSCSPNITNLLSGKFSTRNMFWWWQPALLGQYCDLLNVYSELNSNSSSLEKALNLLMHVFFAFSEVLDLQYCTSMVKFGHVMREKLHVFYSHTVEKVKWPLLAVCWALV